MTKVSFNKLNIGKEVFTKTINFNEMDIEVKQYLDVKSKQDIIDFAIEASAHLPYVNRVISDASFHLFLVLSYTNIELTTKKEKEDPMKVYDLMENSGLIDLVMNSIPEIELSNLVECYEASVKAHDAYLNSFKKIVEDFMDVVPSSVDMIQKSLGDLKDLENLDILKELSAATK